MKKALTVTNVLTRKRDLLPFEGAWLEAIGRPELTGSWLLWGDSGSGKTTFALQLAKYLTGFERVLYNSLEEGASESMKLALLRTGMQEAGKRFLLLDQEPVEEMCERLQQRRAPRVAVIDSLQYSGLSYERYKEMRAALRHVLLIIISHAEGPNPVGKIAQRIRYDAFVKINIHGYRAYCMSRYRVGEGAPITVWAEGAEAFHTEE